MLLAIVNPKGLYSLHDSGHTARHLVGVIINISWVDMGSLPPCRSFFSIQIIAHLAPPLKHKINYGGPECPSPAQGDYIHFWAFAECKTCLFSSF